MSMNQQLILNNLAVSYIKDDSSGNLATILFLHGWRSNKEVWAEIFNKTKGFELYALDFPGFGVSQTPKQPMTVGDYANVVAAFIQKLNLRNVTVVGHSFGGRVGIKLAHHHPELVHKLLLVDSAGFAMDDAKKKVYKSAAKVVKPLFKPKFMQGLRKKIYEHMGAVDYVATPQLQQTFVNIVSEDLTDDMKHIKASTLIVFGEDDEDTPLPFAEKMNALIPHSRFIRFQHAGHFCFLDKPEEFVVELTEFVAQ